MPAIIARRCFVSGRVQGATLSGDATLSGSRLQAQLDWNAQRTAVTSSFERRGAREHHATLR